MNTIATIVLVLAGAIILILLAGLAMKKSHFVKRDITVEAPPQTAFEFLRLLRNQERFNKHAMAGEQRQATTSGTDGSVGFIYRWNGDKSAGEGEKEITDLVDGKMIEQEIRFVRPMAATAKIVFFLEPVPGNRTRISWSNAGFLKYPFNVLIPVMERSVGKDMMESLENLKRILEGK